MIALVLWAIQISPVSSSLYDTLLQDEKDANVQTSLRIQQDESQFLRQNNILESLERSHWNTDTDNGGDDLTALREFHNDNDNDNTHKEHMQFYPELEELHRYMQELKDETIDPEEEEEATIMEYDDADIDTSGDMARIFGGEDALFNQFPYLVELVADGDGRAPRFCHGVMLSGDVAITLAECLYDNAGFIAVAERSSAIVKRGAVNLGQGVYRNWKVIRPHPDYLYGSENNNIGIIKLSGEALVPQMDIGEIESATNQPLANDTVTVMGYGETKLGAGFVSPLVGVPLTKKLQFADFQVLDGVKPCRAKSNETFFCVNNTMGSKVDLCAGDAGAPMVRQSDRRLYGFYMKGGQCNGKAKEAAIFVRVAIYRDFILSTACEIANVRCISTCALLYSYASSGASQVQTVLGLVRTTAANLWNGFLGT